MSENKDTTISLPCLSIHLYLPQSNTMELNTVIFTVLTQINNIDFYLNMQRNMSLISGFPVFPVTSFFRLMIQLFSIVDENLWKFYTNYHFNGTVFFISVTSASFVGLSTFILRSSLGESLKVELKKHS